MPVDLEDGRIWGSRQCFVNIISSLIFSVLHFGLCFYFSNYVFGLQKCRKLCEAIRWMRWPDFSCLKEQQEGWCWRAVFDVPLRLLQCIDCHRASRGFKCMEYKGNVTYKQCKGGVCMSLWDFPRGLRSQYNCILIIRIFIRIILKFLVPLWLGYWYVAIAVLLFAHWVRVYSINFLTAEISLLMHTGSYHSASRNMAQFLPLRWFLYLVLGGGTLFCQKRNWEILRAWMELFLWPVSLPNPLMYKLIKI